MRFGRNVPLTALEPVTADGTVAGTGLWEFTLSRGPESGTDHAAKWETSNMMFLYPDLVAMSELGDGPLNLDMKPPSGIGGLDPRQHASAEVGRRNVELAAEALLAAGEVLVLLAKAPSHPTAEAAERVAARDRRPAFGCRGEKEQDASPPADAVLHRQRAARLSTLPCGCRPPGSTACRKDSWSKTYRRSTV